MPASIFTVRKERQPGPLPHSSHIIDHLQTGEQKTLEVEGYPVVAKGTQEGFSVTVFSAGTRFPATNYHNPADQLMTDSQAEGFGYLVVNQKATQNHRK